MKQFRIFFLVVVFMFAYAQKGMSHEELKDIAPPNVVPEALDTKAAEPPRTIDWGVTGIITGQLMIRGNGPMTGGQVFFFMDSEGPAPSKTKYWTVPDHIVEIGAEGRFTAELPPGKYFLGAIKRVAGEKLGPPREGDLLFVSEDDKGNPKLYPIGPGERVDIGIHSEAEPFSRATLEKENLTIIEGKIMDLNGAPVEGSMVFAFSAPDMVGKPLFVSDRTDKEGKYWLRVSPGGKYFLRVRSDYGGGPPNTGDVMGSYGEGKPVPVAVETGSTRKGVDIKVIRFPGRGPESEKRGL